MKNILILTALFLSNLSMGQHTLQGTLITESAINDASLQTLNKLGLTSDKFIPQEKCRRTGKVDICFLVDATSSMSDQIEFLQSSIFNLLDDLEQKEVIHFRSSAVLYRDHSDSFVAVSSPFSEQKQSTIDFLNTHTATGGGDYPEALSDGFWRAMQLDWQPSADQKILFMFCDAPPHDDPGSLKLFAQGIELAATRGITIIPIVGTEANAFMQVISEYLASESKGAMIQLAPKSNTEESDLYSLIAELLPLHIPKKECELLTQEQLITIAVTPNPASEQVHIKTSAPMQSIEVISAKGTVILRKQIETSEAGINTLEWPAGVYFLNVYFDHSAETKKLVIQH